MTSQNFSLLPTIKSTTKVIPEPKVKTLDIQEKLHHSSSNEKEVAAKSETPKLDIHQCDRKKKQLVECRYDELDERKNAQRRMQVVSFSMSGLKQSLANQNDIEDKDIRGRKFVATVTSERAENELRKHLSQKDFLDGHFEVIGQFNLGFIVVRLLQDDLFIVDQHASDEKFRFETLNKSVKRVTQPLVIPQELRLDPGKREILKNQQLVLESLGFVFDHDLRLTKVPQFGKLSLGPEDIDEILYILSEDNELSGNYQFPRVRSMLASKACRTAVMIGTSLNPSQMRAIIGHMSEMEHPWNCPHGRPTMRHLVNMQVLMS